MGNKIIKAVFFIFTGLIISQSWGQTNPDFSKVKFVLSLPKNTFVLGEPMVVTFTFINNGKEPVEIISTSCFGLMEECLFVYLIDPIGHKSRFVTGVHRDYPKGSAFPTFRLNPSDTVYEIGTLWWFNFLPLMQKEIQGKIENLPSGEYRLKAVYNPQWFVPEPWRNMRLESNEVIFHVIPATGEDLAVLQKMENNQSVREYFLSAAPLPGAIQTFKEIKDKNSIFAEYAHFFYAGFLSPRSVRIAELNNFINKYPNSPSIEMALHELVYDLREENRSKEANKIVEELKLRYSNSMVSRIFFNKLIITPGRYKETK